MEEKLRGMRVNMDQRKRLMAAGRFGIGPLIQMGMVEKTHIQMPVAPMPLVASLTPAAAAAAAEQERRRRESMPGGPPLSGTSPPPELPRVGGGGRGAGGGRDQEQRRQAWRRLHEDDGLQDLEAFLAPKRRAPAARPEAASGSATPASASSGPLAAAGATGDKDANAVAAAKLAVRIAPKPLSLQASSEASLAPDVVRATASTAGARPKSASFKAMQGPSVEDVRRLQHIHEPWGSAKDDPGAGSASPALEAAIDELREEELRRAKLEAKRKREEWRKAFKEEKKKRAAQAKAAKQEADEVGNDAGNASDASSSYDGYKELEKRRKANLVDGSIGTKGMDHEQRRFWGETVKGRVSNDNKGFTDADLEQRFRAQQAATAGENLMTESQVLALLKGSTKEKDKDKEKVKEKTKKREKPKENASRSRERRR